MPKGIRSLLKIIIPLPIRRYIGSFFYGYFGPYSDWETAARSASGYDSQLILDKVSKAVLKVKNNEAVYERDSVTFDRIEQSWPLLAFLLYVAAEKKGQLSLIDFGGSLGSSYFQNRRWLVNLDFLSWKIVEQPNFVRRGQELFQDKQLKFYANIGEAQKALTSDLILFSASLQYLEKPFDILRQVIASGIQYIIFDRLSLTDDGSEIITLQKVPPQIYQASYPCWFFSRDKLISFLSEKYELLAEFPALGGQYRRHSIKGEFKGFIFKRRK